MHTLVDSKARTPAHPCNIGALPINMYLSVQRYMWNTYSVLVTVHTPCPCGQVQEITLNK